MANASEFEVIYKDDVVSGANCVVLSFYGAIGFCFRVLIEHHLKNHCMQKLQSQHSWIDFFKWNIKMLLKKLLGENAEKNHTGTVALFASAFY